MRIKKGFSTRRNPGRTVLYLLVFLFCGHTTLFSQPMHFGERPEDFNRSQIPTEKPPKLLEPLDVEYSAEAQKKRWEGIVIIAAYIDNSGDVIYGEVERSSGYKELDKTALTAVKNGYFKAAWRNNKPVGARLTIPVEFRLPSSQDWNVDKSPDELQKDVEHLRKTRQQVEEERRKLEEEIERLRIQHDSLKRQIKKR